jgi:hypothetical protein
MYIGFRRVSDCLMQVSPLLLLYNNLIIVSNLYFSCNLIYSVCFSTLLSIRTLNVSNTLRLQVVLKRDTCYGAK